MINEHECTKRMLVAKTLWHQHSPRMGCEGACVCEKHSEMCGRCACVRLIVGGAMCDRTFAHFLEQNDQIMLLVQKNIPFFRTFFTVFERPFLFLNIISCFRTSFSVLERPFLF